MPTPLISAVVETVFAIARSARARTPEQRAQNKELRADFWHRRAGMLLVRSAHALQAGKRRRADRLMRRADKAIARRNSLRELADRIRRKATVMKR